LLSAKQVEPGQTGQIEVSVKTEGQSILSKSVTVTTNDPRQPQVVLRVTASVEPEFNLSDRTIYFGSVPRGKEVVKDLLITIPPDKAVRIVSAESTDQMVTVRLEPVPGTGGKQTKLIAIQKMDSKEGYHFGTILIKTTSPLTPELRIPVRGIITAVQNN